MCQKLAENHSTTLFSAGEYFLDETLFAEIHPILSRGENEDFFRIPSIDETWETIQQ